MSNRRIVLIVVGSVLGGLVLVVGCLALFLATYGDPAGKPPAHPVVVGGRIDDGHLTVSLGCTPPQNAQYYVLFFPVDKSPTVGPFPRVEFTEAIPLSVFDPLSLPASASIVQGLPDGFDLRDATGLSVGYTYPGQGARFSADVDLANLSEISLGQPIGLFYFGEAGWLTPEQVASRDGVDLYTVCSPVPPR